MAYALDQLSAGAFIFRCSPPTPARQPFCRAAPPRSSYAHSSIMPCLRNVVRPAPVKHTERSGRAPDRYPDETASSIAPALSGSSDKPKLSTLTYCRR
jgi:hypothetical protein